MSPPLDQLVKLAVKRFGERAATLDPEADMFDALGIDSLQAMDLLTDLEDHFDIEVPDYELQGVTTFRGMAEVIQARL